MRRIDPFLQNVVVKCLALFSVCEVRGSYLQSCLDFSRVFV
jgi:hypothetical protein